MDNDDLFRRTAANRRRAADLLAGLTPEQWSTPSLCAGWTVRELAGHLIMPMKTSIPWGSSSLWCGRADRRTGPST